MIKEIKLQTKMRYEIKEYQYPAVKLLVYWRRKVCLSKPIDEFSIQ